MYFRVLPHTTHVRVHVRIGRTCSCPCTPLTTHQRLTATRRPARSPFAFCRFFNAMPSIHSYSPKGLVHEMQWGTLRVTANAAALKLAYSKYAVDTQRQRCWARQQLRLMLGDWGRSFVVGFGTNPPQRPHHSSSMCDPVYSIVCDGNTAALDRPNPSVLRGALVGGPRKDGTWKGAWS
jgi:hypothetical protein